MRILVADDDPLCLAVITVPLRALGGLDITEAADGEKAWGLMKRNIYDVVILDWQMPGKSGPEVVAAARAEGLTVPILMVTAEASRSHVLKAIRAGVSDYLIKPFDFETLLAKLGRLTGRPLTRGPVGAA